MKNKVWFAVGILFVVVAAAYLYYSGQYINVYNALQSMNKWWLLAGLGCIAGYWFLDTKIIHSLVNELYEKRSFKQALKVSLIGQFFCGITPFATGGQPAQLILLNKSKIPMGIGSSILMSKFIVYQAVLVVYSAFLLVVKGKMFLSSVNNLFGLVIIGFGVNLLVITGLVMITYAKKANERFSTFIINVLYKFKIIKDKEAAQLKMKEHIKEFHDQIEIMRGHTPLVIKTIIMTILQLTCYFIVPFCLYKGFGLSGVSVINIVAATAFVLMVTSFVPMPGGSGGAEGGFYVIFGMFFIPNLIVPAILVWRIITYYLWMFIGGMWMLSSRVRFARS